MRWSEVAVGAACGVGLALAVSMLRARRAKVPDRGRVLTVVLTGGPCAGKSSSLDTISGCTRASGYDCYSVPEVPTIMLDGGLQFPAHDEEQLVAFEVHLLRLQLAAEDAWVGVARATGRPAVVVLDRGAMDVKAYLSETLWRRVLAGVGVTEAQLMARYDMVIHLTTAAYGAEQHYTVDNNPSRRETPAQAREADDKVRVAWQAFPGHAVVRNETDFEGKLAAVQAHIQGLIDRSSW